MDVNIDVMLLSFRTEAGSIQLLRMSTPQADIIVPIVDIFVVKCNRSSPKIAFDRARRRVCKSAGVESGFGKNRDVVDQRCLNLLGGEYRVCTTTNDQVESNPNVRHTHSTSTLYIPRRFLWCDLAHGKLVTIARLAAAGKLR